MKIFKNTYFEELLRRASSSFLHCCSPFCKCFSAFWSNFLGIWELCEYEIIATASKVSVFGVILVRIFSHSDWLLRDYLSVFTLNAGKCGPE